MADEKSYWDIRISWYCPHCRHREETDGRILSHTCPKCLKRMMRLPESSGSRRVQWPENEFIREDRY